MNNTLAYLIFTIVMLHLLAGFIWAFIKMNKKPSKVNTKRRNVKSKEKTSID